MLNSVAETKMSSKEKVFRKRLGKQVVQNNIFCLVLPNFDATEMFLGLKYAGPKNKQLTLTRPIGLPPLTLAAQKIADQRRLIANSAKKSTFFIK